VLARHDIEFALGAIRQPAPWSSLSNSAAPCAWLRFACADGISGAGRDHKNLRSSVQIEGTRNPHRPAQLVNISHRHPFVFSLLFGFVQPKISIKIEFRGFRAAAQIDLQRARQCRPEICNSRVRC
jgi:hypothetical protein